MKKIVKVKQCTILCHVDDLNMSHIDYEIVSSVISDIDAEYGKISKRPSHGLRYTNTLGWPSTTSIQEN